MARIVMKEKVTVGARLPQEYVDEIDAICKTTGKTRSEVFLEAIEMYLGKVSNDGIRSELEEAKRRLAVVEKRLAWMGSAS